MQDGVFSIEGMKEYYLHYLSLFLNCVLFAVISPPCDYALLY